MARRVCELTVIRAAVIGVHGGLFEVGTGARRESADTAELQERRTIEPVVAVFLNSVELKPKFERVPPGRVQQRVVQLKRVENEISWNKKFAAERQRAVVEIKPRKIALRQACALQNAGGFGAVGHAKRDMTAVQAVGEAKVVERIGRELMSESRCQITERTGEGSGEATNSRPKQLRARHVAGCQVGVPTRKNFVPGIDAMVHPDNVLVRSIAFDLRRLSRAGGVSGTGGCETLGSGKILKEHRRQTARRRLTTGVRRLANHKFGTAILQPRAFVVHEEKGLVLLDRAAEGKAELVQLKGSFFDRSVEKVPGIKGSVPIVVKQRAVKIVCAGFRNDIYNRPVVAPILRREIQGLDLHFLNCFQRGINQWRSSEPLIIVRGAIQHEVVASRRGTIGDESGIEGYGRSRRGHAGDYRSIGRRDPGLFRDQLVDLSAVEGK